MPPEIVRALKYRALVPLVPYSVRWLKKGSQPGGTASTDLTVICLVKNGEFHLDGFIESHLNLGASQIVLMDNGSTDRTVEKALKHGGKVTVLQSKLSYKNFQVAMRAWMAARFSGKGWCLVTDIDERFAYPCANNLTLPQFLDYLNLYGYSSVVAHMVDLFPGSPIRDWPTNEKDLMRAPLWYDHSTINEHSKIPQWPDWKRNSYPSSLQTMKTGGISQIIFGHARQLSKHALIRPALGARILTHQEAANSRVADVSCALLHYAFDGYFRDKCSEAVAKGNYWNNSQRYRVYLKQLEIHGDGLTLKRQTARRFIHADQLLEEGFLVISDEYRKLAKCK